MSLVIVTKHCYLLCEKVNYITIEEGRDRLEEEEPSLRRLSLIDKFFPRKTEQQLSPRIEKYWSINLSYVPDNGTASNSRMQREEGNVSIRVYEKTEAFHLYKEIVSEIRDQCPDLLYLDKLIDSVLIDARGADIEA